MIRYLNFLIGGYLMPQIRLGQVGLRLSSTTSTYAVALPLQPAFLGLHYEMILTYFTPALTKTDRLESKALYKSEIVLPQPAAGVAFSLDRDLCCTTSLLPTPAVWLYWA